MSGYAQGRRVEWQVVHDLTDDGYEVTRAASSKGAADVIAAKHGQILFVSVKRQKMPPPAERAALLQPPRCRRPPRRAQTATTAPGVPAALGRGAAGVGGMGAR